MNNAEVIAASNVKTYCRDILIKPFDIGPKTDLWVNKIKLKTRT